MTEFTPVSAIVGGLLIGLSAMLLLWFNGRIAGISGIVYGAFGGDDKRWRWWFIAGVALGGGLWTLTQGIAPFRSGFSWPLLAVAGFVVGFGTRLGSGCTSGHGLCGIGRIAPRSIFATLTFLATGMLTVFVVRHLLGVAP